VDQADVDLLWAVLVAADSPAEGRFRARFDLSGDGLVDARDASVLIETFLGTSMADTNLDCRVDILDLCNLANHYNQTGDFGDGDADSNGLINILDLAELANAFQCTPTASAAEPVPEPVSACLWLVGLSWVLRNRVKTR